METNGEVAAWLPDGLGYGLVGKAKMGWARPLSDPTPSSRSNQAGLSVRETHRCGQGSSRTLYGKTHGYVLRCALNDSLTT